MEEQREIQRQFRQQQEKFVYNLIALSVTAIGFSIYKTTGQPLKWIQLPLGTAILCWGLSIFCGLSLLKYVISTLYANNTYFDIIQGRNSEIGNHPQKIEAATSGVKQAMDINSNRASSYSKWQERLFYLGIVLFLVWHITEMYQVIPH
ncbi:hypothetical protein [Anditalea andensis]|uniref:Uncharacterized protein n=1 Tax=Anditalea andensis TaxID=1048983 RepID=A0A074KSK4_9BACT|nr:hypothetical protein [Anditalea andensis]KEO72941.1 hypothetical protein EL17_15075 [Anditalea andensis]